MQNVNTYSLCAKQLSIFHRDSSIHLRPTPSPNFYATKSFSKVGSYALRCAPNFMKLTPEFLMLLSFWCPHFGTPVSALESSSQLNALSDI